MADSYHSPASLLRGITSPSEALHLAIAWLDGYEAEGEAYDRRNGASSHPPPPAEADCDDEGAAAPSSSSSSSSSASSSTSHPVEDAIALLSELRDRVSRDGLISDNEALDDVPTSALELLGAEYHLGRARLMLPAAATTAPDAAGGPGPPLLRRRNVVLAIGHYLSFLRRLERLGEGMLEDATLAECRRLLDLEEGEDGGDGDGDGERGVSSLSARTNPYESREAKIRRYKRRKAMENRRLRLQSQLQRRSRLGLPDEEALDGHDAESLTRTVHLETLRLHAETSLEEVHSSRREMEMLDIAERMSTTGESAGTASARRMPPSSSSNADDGGPPDRRRPLQMTQITQNPTTGRLELTTKRVADDGRLLPAQFAPRPTTINRRDEISSGVFRPGWNLPTMTLEELGERELADAVRRAEEQRYAEADAMLRPRRYDQLERDGMEDDHGLVEASARLDREWDDWKDENPRGCGNKMGERGDRNF
jgi:immunoglobulin-binding protein 1